MDDDDLKDDLSPLIRWWVDGWMVSGGLVDGWMVIGGWMDDADLKDDLSPLIRWWVAANSEYSLGIMNVFGTKLKCFGPFAICSRSMFLYILNG